jgi:hypothetical protein
LNLKPKLLKFVEMSRMLYETFITIRFMCLDMEEFRELMISDSLNT